LSAGIVISVQLKQKRNAFSAFRFLFESDDRFRCF
jgi:hypothetical protein